MDNIVVKGLGDALKDAVKRAASIVDSAGLKPLSFSVLVIEDDNLNIREAPHIDKLYSLIIFMFEMELREEIKTDACIKRIMKDSQNYTFEISKPIQAV